MEHGPALLHTANAASSDVHSVPCGGGGGGDGGGEAGGGDGGGEGGGGAASNVKLKEPDAKTVVLTVVPANAVIATE